MGSVRRSPKTSRWEARYRDPLGRQRTKTFATKADARAFLAAAQTDAMRGQWLDPTGARVTYQEWSEQYFATAVHKRATTAARDRTVNDKQSQGWITAVDGTSGTVRWKYRSTRPIVGAVTSTAGGLILAGELTGDFVAFDADSGAVRYRFNTGGPIGAGIVTYEAGGRQYIAVASGRPSRFWVQDHQGSPLVMVFALDEAAK